MFHVKLCGVTGVQDAVLAAESGADAVGLNFSLKSPRYVSAEQAAAISQALPAEVARVGVFVNSSLGDVLSVAAQVGLTHVQLHGGEPEGFVRQLHTELQRATRRPDQPSKIIYVSRVRSEALEELEQQLVTLADWSPVISGILLDAYHPSSHGGTGQRLDWSGLSACRHLWTQSRGAACPLILAGGLTPENVAQAIDMVRPFGVDVASGVEAEPGRKDPAKVRQFVKNALQAINQQGLLQADQ